ncbi:similar to Saccharomyces cerevisiae YGL137W SEC27 Essential beta'-coat protein of the COPI coatomer, involved in ER-to-Golgi and Golgi-to-ER transport [Maudiozyma saulgeensis]|uniref:Coatomer subunit beta' n=1 Tax=Maudiozyma saulgeensis TaxID=1789683 RepID=A0A1X7R015_9SACH|nr:similar to Saccharomyces cerevisiae YGL137W SEC27 Essential beta'-coat protein of the COPI coatomer, involved in ER-to-Golgi and Golgi-to-ER transport [Kazachstania saulgeensis]
MKLDITKTFTNRTNRVKGIDFHPKEPWVLTTLYTGQVEIWNYETKQEVRSIQVTETPVRAGKFIARKNWIVVGCDDFRIKVFNYNTGEKVADFEAHPDYIRSIAVHPTKPYILSGSDDLTIKLWNWEKNWALEQTFEGHEHFVMCVTFNPKDPNTFASACLDRTVKVWSLGQSTPNFTLETKQEKGVNYVDYYPSPDKPYLITSSDDMTIKVWDYQTKSCVATLEGHMSNVSYAVFHPSLPVIISGSEDGTVKVWNSATYKAEKTLNVGLERSWCIAVHPAGKKNYIASGFDGGFTVLSLGNDEPALSLDPVGKLVWSGGKTGSANDIFTTAIRGNEEAEEGEPLPLQSKELGSVDIFPQSLSHSPNGRFVAVVGDGEYVIYTALAWRNKDFGKCIDFVWGPDSNSYAIIDLDGNIQLYKNFKLVSNWSVRQDNGRAEKLYGGALLGVNMYKMAYFYDWETGRMVRRLDINPGNVYWSDAGELLMVTNGNLDPAADEAKAQALFFDKEKYLEAVEAAKDDWKGDDIAETMEVLYEVNESITSGKWVGDVFIFTTLSNRLNYFVGGKTYNLAHYTKDIYLLGYIARDNKVYLADRQVHVYAEEIALEVLEFQTLTLRGELEDAIETVLPNIDSKRSLLKLSRFLEGQEYYEEALKISPDNEQKFDLALKTKKLQMARDLLKENDPESKWIALGDMSLQLFNFKLAIEAYTIAHDLESLFLLYSSFNNRDALIKIGEDAEALGKFNLAFNSYWTAGSVEKAKDLLVKVNRFSEAAILSSTYGLGEEQINEVVDLWKNQLDLDGKGAIAERIIKPSETKTTSGSKAEEQPLIDLDNKPIAEPVATEEIPEKEEQPVEKQEEEEEEEEEEEPKTVADDGEDANEEEEETADAKDL